MESHYCRKDSSKIYIATSFKNKADIYKNYESKCLENKVRPVSTFTFYNFFEEHNMALYKPRKDECDTCVGFRAKQVALEEYTIHISKKKCTIGKTTGQSCSSRRKMPCLYHGCTSSQTLSRYKRIRYLL